MLKLLINNNAIANVKSFTQEQRQAGNDSLLRWNLTLEDAKATASGRQLLIESLSTLAGLDVDAIIEINGETLAEMSIVDSRIGPRISAVSRTDDGDVHSGNAVKLAIEARLQDTTSDIQWSELRTRTVVSQGISKLITDLRVTLKRGENPENHLLALTPTILSGFVRRELIVKTDAPESSIEIQTTDEQVFQQLPANVDDGHYTVTIASSDSGLVRRIKGFFMGVGARAQALNMRPLNCISERLTEDSFTRRIDFEYECDAESGQNISESLTFTTTHRIIDHPVLGNFPAVRQVIGQPYMEVTQEGIASGVGKHPSPPAPRFPADLIERKVHYSPAREGQSRVTTWVYRFRGRALLAESRPEVL
ncbi:MAG: hypothetical protein L3J82_06155 [Planctomycetes bacterium]|nr:hypothetical protein [Planctomycetota bacterium]